MKAPKNLPQVGDTVRLKGRGLTGVLVRVNDRLWSFVSWDDTQLPGPKIVHLYELEKYSQPHYESTIRK